MFVTVVRIVDGSLYSQQKIDKRTGGVPNKRKSGHCLNYSIIEIGQNTKKSPGGLRRLALTQTPLRNY